jgi:GAF domain-containing protein
VPSDRGLAGLAGQATLAAAMRQTPVRALAAGASAGNGGHRWPVPPFGEPGYDELLTTTVESARVAVGADAAFAMVPDEDGELRLRAASGSFSSLAGGTAGQAGQATELPVAPGRASRAGRARLPSRAGLPGKVGQARQGGLAGQAGTSAPSLAEVRAAAGAAPSVLTVPFVVDGRVTGLLSVASGTVDRFRDDEAVRLQQLADRWGPPLERARLGELERVRRGRIGALAHARTLLAGSFDPNEVLALAGEAAVPRLAPWCAVLLPSEGMGLRAVYARHVDEERVPALAWLLDRMAEMVAAADPPPRPPRQGRLGPVRRWSLAVPGLAQAPSGADALAVETAWCFPLGAGTDGTGTGMLAVGHRRDERLPSELAELAADLACRIGVALDNARLVSRQR